MQATNSKGGREGKKRRGGGGRGRGAGGGGGGGRGGREERLSRQLALILRHKALERGLKMGKDGFVDLEELLNKCLKSQGYTREDVEAVVASNDKKRYTIIERNGRTLIRADQGHSIPGLTELELKRVTSAGEYPVVVHGTYYDAWRVIKSEGLHRMGRNHIHFAKGLIGEEGVISGMRRTCEVFIYVDLEQALADGIEFYESGNGVILSAGIDGVLHPKYFSKVVDAATRRTITL
jgi:2'-phosphotransferase